MSTGNETTQELRTINGENDVDSLESNNEEMLQETGSCGSGDQDEEGSGSGSDSQIIVNIKEGQMDTFFTNIFKFKFNIQWTNGTLTQSISSRVTATVTEVEILDLEHTLNGQFQSIDARWSGVNGCVSIISVFSYEYYPNGKSQPESVQTRYGHADFQFNVPDEYISRQ